MMINKDFFKDARFTAENLLGKILVRRINNKILKAKVVETEAYFDEKDPASRAVQNGDLRETMMMKPGTTLVYGVHNNWLFNIVTGDIGKAEAVLLRAVEPLNFKNRTNGPGLLTKALDINKGFHKKSIIESKELWLEDNNENFEIVRSFRIGVKKDLREKLRFYIKDNKYVSKK